jgi:cytochrome c-type biogenesis protein CcsB
MIDPLKQSIDQSLLVLALAAYIIGTLVAIAYFLMRSPLLRRIMIPLAIIGCAAQFAELGARWNMTGVWPLTNLYGSLSLFSALGVLIFTVFAFRYNLWLVGGGVLGIAAISLGYATMWNEGYMPAVPALQSYWIKIHVPLVISAYATFMVAFVVSALYLLKDACERRFGTRVLAPATSQGPALAAAGASYATATTAWPVGGGIVRSDTPNITLAAQAGDPLAVWLAGLPSLATLDLMTYRVIAVGLPLLSIGIITGAMWAKEAWGAYWQWDPKETAALTSWIVYAMYMHLHTRNSWRGLRSAWLTIIGFASIVFCYLGVNIFISGLHSYKM